MGHAMVFNLWHIASNTIHGTGIKLLFKKLDTSKMFFDKEQNSILTTFGKQLGNRKDHKQVYDYVLKKLGGIASENNMNTWEYKSCFNFLLLVKVIYWGLMLKIELSFRERLLVICSTMLFCNTLKDIKKMSFDGVEKYISMYNASEMENVFTQYFHLHGVKTYSLSEGLYMVYEDNIPIDAVNYDNLETDKLIVWSQWVKDSFIKAGVSERRLHVGGYPHTMERVSMKENNPFHKCVVLLSRQILHESNQRLLKVLACFSSQIQFELKLHPSLNYAEYDMIANEYGMSIVPADVTLADCMSNKNYDFAVAGQTTAYYEALAKGVPCLRFDDGSYTLMKGYNDIFTNKTNFNVILSSIRNLPTTQYQAEVNDMLEYCLGLGIDNYYKIIME